MRKLILLLLTAALACRDPSQGDRAGQTARLERDLIVEGDVTSSVKTLEASEVFCADETYLAWSLAPGEELSFVFEATSGDLLSLSACTGAGSATVHLEVAAAGGEEGVEADLAFRGRWETREVTVVRSGTARARLTVELPEGGKLFLRDLLLSRSSPIPPAPGPDVPQVLLISVDTFREDAIRALGGGEPTPVIDALVAESQVFSPHYAAAAWTKPSHASMLTGTWPEMNGAGISPESRIREGIDPLAARFRRHGFLTAGLVFDCVWLDPEFGFSRGFDVYAARRARVPRLARESGDWIARHRDQPFFYFLHTFEVHSDFQALPYEAPGVTREVLKERFGVDGYGCREGQCASFLLGAIKDRKVDAIPQEEEILRYLYGQSVQYLDSELGRLFGRLRELGLWDRMTIVLTSDHGEQFFEHGSVEHGWSWEEVLRVPLIIKWPQGRSAGERVEEPTSSVDLAPTLLAAYGIEAEDLPGQSLLKGRPDVPIFAGDTWKAMRMGRYKMVLQMDRTQRQLFDLESDPEERHDLSEERPEELERLLAIFRKHEGRVARWRQALEDASHRELGTEDRSRLEALGYLGGD